MSTLGNIYTNNEIIGEKMHGVVDGIFYCNSERNNELNRRISSRNVPSAPLQPQYSMRPVSTKYDMMGIVDRRPKTTENENIYPIYNVKHTFNPGSSVAPWSGFASHIDDESRLRNKFFAIQKCEQAAYVPNSNSELYNINIPQTNNMQPHPDLFKPPDFEPFNPNTCNIGNMFFDNFTRQQIKDI